MPRAKKKYNERLELGRASDGSRIRKWIRADTKPELEALRREAYKELNKTVLNSSLFGVYARKWFDTYKSNKSLQTMNMYDYAIRKLSSLDNKNVSDVTGTDLQEIIKEHWDHPRACEVLRLTIRQIFGCAVRDRLVEFTANPASDLVIPPPKKSRIRFITDDEMEKILKCKFKKQDRLYIDVLRYTGMRPSEALALMWDDVNYKEKLIHVQRSFEYEGSKTHIKGTKTDTLRDIPLSNSLASLLKSAKKNSEYVFTKEDGGLFTKSAYIKMSKRIFDLITEAIGENNLVMYSFRHTFANFLYYHGCRPGLISTKKAAQIMGHSEKIFIERYTHIDDSKESVAQIINLI